MVSVKKLVLKRLVSKMFTEKHLNISEVFRRRSNKTALKWR